MARRNPRIACPVEGCTKAYASKAAVGGHMRNDHGVYGGLSGVNRPDRLAANGTGKELVLKLPTEELKLYDPPGLTLKTDGQDLYLVQKLPRL